MEFSSRKPVTPKSHSKPNYRHAPYMTASGSKYQMTKYHKRTSYSLSKSCDVTPPRNPLHVANSQLTQNGHHVRTKIFNSQPKQYSRGVAMLTNSLSKTDAKNYSVDGSRLSETERATKFSSKKLLNKTQNESDDPRGIFSDSDDNDDDVILNVRYTQSDTDKENNNNNLPKTNNQFHNAIRRKSLGIRSSILHDISPKKVTQAYNGPNNNILKKENCAFTFKSFGNKENESSISLRNEPKPDPVIEYTYLIGFPNYGNTCYLNAVLQTLVNLEPFVVGISSIMSKIHVASNSLTHSLWSLIVGRQHKDLQAIKKALRNFKENVEKVDGSFSGFKMQDANEFLTQVLDTVKDEIDRSFNVSNLNSSPFSNNNNSVNNGQTIPSSVPLLVSPQTVNSMRNIKINSADKTGRSSLFDTPSPDSPVSLELKLKGGDISSSDDENIFSKKYNATSTLTFNNQCLSETAKSQEHVSAHRQTGSVVLNFPLNPVKDNYEFELLESYRCLGCGSVDGRKQKHFALYVNLPTAGQESIQHAVESYMTEDQRELTCDNCQHKRAAVITTFEKLPRILIVQMKRYKYNPEQLECIKVSSKVEVNLWLRLDSLTSQNVQQPQQWTPAPLKSMNDQESAVVTNCNGIRNLSSELNICDTASGRNGDNTENDAVNEVPVSTTVATPTKTDEERDKELEEVMIRSLEDVGSQQIPDREEEEFQRAIKLSLQDMGMCYSHEEPVTTKEGKVGHNGVTLSRDEVKATEEGDDAEEVEGTHSYRLLSVISHFGMTTCTGHYVSDIFNCEENQWFHYDDEAVAKLQETTVLAEGRQKNAYIFFYIHQDVYNQLQTSPRTSAIGSSQV